MERKWCFVNVIFNCIAIYVSLCSCSTGRIFSLNRTASLEGLDNKVVLWDKTNFQLNQASSLSEDDLLCQGSELDNKMRDYIRKILKDCDMPCDSVAIVLPGVIIVDDGVEHTEGSFTFQYLYCYNYESEKWEIWNGKTLEGDIKPGVTYPFSFYRSLFVNHKEKRVVIKDVFEDKIFLYVVQKDKDEIPYSTTKIWDPSDFTQVVTLLEYVKSEVDPISYQIAKQKKQTNER